MSLNYCWCDRNVIKIPMKLQGDRNVEKLCTPMGHRRAIEQVENSVTIDRNVVAKLEEVDTLQGVMTKDRNVAK